MLEKMATLSVNRTVALMRSAISLFDLDNAGKLIWRFYTLSNIDFVTWVTRHGLDAMITMEGENTPGLSKTTKGFAAYFRALRRDVEWNSHAKREHVAQTVHNVGYRFPEGDPAFNAYDLPAKK